jgi:hypothetical protein
VKSQDRGVAVAALYNLGVLIRDRVGGAAHVTEMETLLDEAQDLFTAVGQLGHSEISPRALLNLGVLHAARGRYGQAVRAYTAAKSTGHSEAAVCAAFNLGWLQTWDDPGAAEAALAEVVDSVHPLASRAAVYLVCIGGRGCIATPSARRSITASRRLSPRTSRVQARPFKDEIHRLLRDDPKLPGVRVRELLEPRRRWSNSQPAPTACPRHRCRIVARVLR